MKKKLLLGGIVLIPLLILIVFFALDVKVVEGFIELLQNVTLVSAIIFGYCVLIFIAYQYLVKEKFSVSEAEFPLIKFKPKELDLVLEISTLLELASLIKQETCNMLEQEQLYTAYYYYLKHKGRADTEEFNVINIEDVSISDYTYCHCFKVGNKQLAIVSNYKIDSTSDLVELPFFLEAATTDKVKG